MKRIWSSASKTVFVSIALALCFAFLFEVVRKEIILDAKDFLGLAMMAFTYYFTRSTNPTRPSGTGGE